jgi:hypothetical protein
VLGVKALMDFGLQASPCMTRRQSRREDHLEHDELACAVRPLHDHHHDIGNVHEGKICHIIEVEHRVLEENSWVLTRIYPAILSPNFGKIVNNSANLEDDDE